MDSVLQRLKQLEAAVEDLEAGGFMPKAGMPPQVGMLPANAGMQGAQPQMAAIPVQAAGTPGVPSGNASEAVGIVLNQLF